MSGETEEAVRRRVGTADYRKKLLQHKELESRVRGGSLDPLLQTLAPLSLILISLSIVA